MGQSTQPGYHRAGTAMWKLLIATRHTILLWIAALSADYHQGTTAHHAVPRTQPDCTAQATTWREGTTWTSYFRRGR